MPKREASKRDMEATEIGGAPLIGVSTYLATAS